MASYLSSFDEMLTTRTISVETFFTVIPWLATPEGNCARALFT